MEIVKIGSRYAIMLHGHYLWADCQLHPIASPSERCGDGEVGGWISIEKVNNFLHKSEIVAIKEWVEADFAAC